jgi:hypothetical protein
VSAADVVHYLGRTEEECIAAGQSTICEGCKMLKRQRTDAALLAMFGDGRRDAVTEWREDLGYDPVTGGVL